MKSAAVIVLLACGVLAGCGKAETVSTDTAVTETVAPEPIVESTDTASTDPSVPVGDKAEAATDSSTTDDSGEN